MINQEERKRRRSSWWVGFISLIIGIGLWRGLAWDRREQRPISPATLSKISPTPVLERVAAPSKLLIPSLNITAPVEKVGLTSEGRMGVPSGWFNAGWYELGPKPGERGSAVIAGHLDTPNGPAIFWKLKELKTGDIIEVEDEQQSVRKFKVINTETYADYSFPLDLVFAKNDGNWLNLITCEGTFDRKNKNYSHRLVVFAQLLGT